MASQAEKPISIQQILADEGQAEAMIESKPLSFWQIALRRIKRDKLTLAALSILAVILLASLGAEIINNFLGVDPFDTDLLASLEPPSRAHLLGTDTLGQDQFARLLYAGRISMAIGFFGAIFTLIIGVTLGMVAAYSGGILDDIIMWVINTLNSIPQLFLLFLEYSRSQGMYHPLPGRLLFFEAH